MRVIDVTRSEQFISPQIFKNQRLRIDGDMNRKMKLRFLIFTRRSTINLIVVESLLVVFIDSRFFSFIDSDKMIMVRNLKDLSRDLSCLFIVTKYSVHRRYEFLFFLITARLSNLKTNTLTHYPQDLHLELTYIVLLFDHRKRRYD